MKLKNKIAVITGGSSGIGFAIAKEFIAEGAKVVITGRNTNKLQQAQQSLGQAALAITADVTEIADLDKVYQQTQQQFGTVDLLVANAGIGKMGKLASMTEHDFYEIFDTNVKGVYFTMQRALPFLNQSASIILISSLAAKIATAGNSLYAASKAAVTHLSKCFAAEFIEQGFRVNSISPTFTETSFFDQLPLTSEQLQQIAANIPMKRMAQPSEIAKAAVFLASDDSSYITGSDLLLDGGRYTIR